MADTVIQPEVEANAGYVCPFYVLCSNGCAPQGISATCRVVDAELGAWSFGLTSPPSYPSGDADGSQNMSRKIMG